MMGIYRLILSFFVALSHAGILVFGYNTGIVAVISFFLLSGYVMTALIEKYYREPFDVWSFYRDRSLRIFPQYVLYLIIATLCIHAFQIESGFTNQLTLTKWLLNLAMLPLAVFMYWADGAIVLPQAWSLGLEWTFYLVIPWIIRFLTFRYKIALAIASLIVFFFAFTGALYTDWYGYRLLPGTLFMFLAGSLFYNADRKSLFAVISVFGIAMGSFVIMKIHTRFYDLHYNKEVLLGLLIGIPVLGVMRFLKSSRIDEMLGNISYGVFLNHTIVIWGIEKFFGVSQFKLLHILLMICVSSLFAFASYYVIERPILLFRRKSRERRVRSQDTQLSYEMASPSSQKVSG